MAKTGVISKVCTVAFLLVFLPNAHAGKNYLLDFVEVGIVADTSLSSPDLGATMKRSPGFLNLRVGHGIFFLLGPVGIGGTLADIYLNDIRTWEPKGGERYIKRHASFLTPELYVKLISLGTLADTKAYAFGRAPLFTMYGSNHFSGNLISADAGLGVSLSPWRKFPIDLRFGWSYLATRKPSKTLFNSVFANLFFSFGGWSYEKLPGRPIGRIAALIKFEDDTGDGMLERGERGKIIVTVQNKEDFPLQNLSVSFSFDDPELSRYVKVEEGEMCFLEEIGPWEKKVLTLPIIAAIDLPQTEIRGKVSVKTKDGKSIWSRPIKIASLVRGTEEVGAIKVTESFSLWAVVVGISRYIDQRIPSLKYADDDAKAFFKFLKELRNKRVFEDVHIRYLLNDEATLRNIKSAMSDLIDAREDDLVIVYFAGHGMVDKVGEPYFLPYETNSDDIYATAFSMDEFFRFFRDKIVSTKTIVIADACHSGSLGAGGVRNIPDIYTKFSMLIRGTRGKAFLTASRARELSHESDKLGHGVFTYYLIKGMKGEADASGDGIVTISELYDYLYDKVKEETDGAQHPELKGNYDNDMPVSIVR